jgi:hypothetical protein
MKTEKLKVFYGLDNVDVVVFSTEALCATGYIFKINKDFKIDSTEKPFYGYYVDLCDKEILNLKQFKIEII